MLKFVHFNEGALADGHGAGEVMYRGNSDKAKANPTGLYATSDKEFAAGYGKVTAHKISSKAKLLDMDHPGAHEKLGHDTSIYDRVPNKEHRDQAMLSDRLGAFGHAGAEDEFGAKIRDGLASAGYHGMSTKHGMDGHTRVFVLPGHFKDHDEGAIKEESDNRMRKFSEFNEMIKYDYSKSDGDIVKYHIMHKDGKKVGEAKTKNGARRSVDNHDNKYGGYAHHAVAVYKDSSKD